MTDRVIPQDKVQSTQLLPESINNAVNSGATPGWFLLSLGVFIVVVTCTSYGWYRYVISNDQAIGAIKREKEQSSAHSNNTTGSNQSEQEELQAAIVTIEDSLKQFPNSEQLKLRLANLYYNVGSFERSVQLYVNYLKNHPNDINARIDCGYSLFSLGKRQEGIDMTSLALKVDPTSQPALFNLGVMYYEMNNFKKSLGYFILCKQANSTSEIGQRSQLAIEQLQQKFGLNDTTKAQ